jgi:hypothetical protein
MNMDSESYKIKQKSVWCVSGHGSIKPWLQWLEVTEGTEMVVVAA